jgi:phosphopantothenoylcysteine synthetase/decarboxylase
LIIVDAQEASKNSDLKFTNDLLDEEDADGAEVKWQLTVNRRGEKEPLKIKCRPTSTIGQLCRTILKISNETRVGFGLTLHNCDGDLLSDPNATVENSGIEDGDQVDTLVLEGGISRIQPVVVEEVIEQIEVKWQLTVNRRGEKEPLKIKCRPTSTIGQLCRTILKISNETRVGFGLTLHNCEGGVISDAALMIKDAGIEDGDQLDSSVVEGGISGTRAAAVDEESEAFDLVIRGDKELDNRSVTLKVSLI